MLRLQNPISISGRDNWKTIIQRLLRVFEDSAVDFDFNVTNTDYIVQGISILTLSM